MCTNGSPTSSYRYRNYHFSAAYSSGRSHSGLQWCPNALSGSIHSRAFHH